jgi:hypothetical protein
MDGNSLLATHYCPKGNQSRLEYVGNPSSERLYFAFRDGTNLNVKGKWHQHAFWVRLVDDKRFERCEIYVENGGNYNPKEIPPQTPFQKFIRKTQE